MGYVLIGCQVALAGVFLFSLISKVRSREAYEEFAASVAVLGLLPYRWSRIAAATTVAGEAGALVLLAVPPAAPAGFVVAGGLLLAFIVAIALTVRHGTRVPCRCFGASSAPLGLPHLIRNVVLLAACGLGLGLAAGYAPGAAFGDPAWLVISLVVAAVVVLFAVRLDDLVALFASPDLPATAGKPSGSRKT